jgi:hypothetical protein
MYIRLYVAVSIDTLAGLSKVSAYLLERYLKFLMKLLGYTSLFRHLPVILEQTERAASH